MLFVSIKIMTYTKSYNPFQVLLRRTKLHINLDEKIGKSKMREVLQCYNNADETDIYRLDQWSGKFCVLSSKKAMD